MKKITIIIQDNALLFKYRTNKPVATNLLNTNIISDNELVFSEEYMMQNAEIVSLFLKDLCVEMGTAKIEVSHHDMVSLVLRVTCKLEKIDCFTIREDYSIPYSIVEEIIKCGFKITQDQLDVFVPVCIREGNYIDCAAVTVNVLNRQFSYGWTQQAITNM